MSHFGLFLFVMPLCFVELLHYLFLDFGLSDRVLNNRNSAFKWLGHVCEPRA